MARRQCNGAVFRSKKFEFGLKMAGKVECSERAKRKARSSSETWSYLSCLMVLATEVCCQASPYCIPFQCNSRIEWCIAMYI